MATPVKLNLGEVVAVPLTTANECTETELPGGRDSGGGKKERKARWITIWELSSSTATLYVVEKSYSGAVIPANRRKISSYPTCIDIKGWKGFYLTSDTNSVTAYVEATRAYDERDNDCP